MGTGCSPFNLASDIHLGMNSGIDMGMDVDLEIGLNLYTCWLQVWTLAWILAWTWFLSPYDALPSHRGSPQGIETGKVSSDLHTAQTRHGKLTKQENKTS